MEDSVNETTNIRRIRLNHIRSIARTIRLNGSNQAGDYQRTVHPRTLEQHTSPLHNMEIDDGASDGGQARQISPDNTIQIRDQWCRNYRIRRASLSIEQVRQANSRLRAAYRNQRRRLNEVSTTNGNHQVNTDNSMDRMDYVIPVPHGEGSSAGANNNNPLPQPHIQNEVNMENPNDGMDYVIPIPHGLHVTLTLLQ